MTPSPEVPATVHHGDGQVMSFWRYLSPSGGDARGSDASGGGPGGGVLASEDVIGPMLRDLHAELARYPGQLPVLAPLQDIPAYLARPQTTLTPAEAAALAAAHARLTAELGSFPARPLLSRRAVFPARDPAARTVIETGLAGRPIPVEQGGRLGRTMLTQLAEPFVSIRTESR
jgi:hypothetical protein